MANSTKTKLSFKVSDNYNKKYNSGSLSFYKKEFRPIKPTNNDKTSIATTLSSLYKKDNFPTLPTNKTKTASTKNISSSTNSWINGIPSEVKTHIANKVADNKTTTPKSKTASKSESASKSTSHNTYDDEGYASSYYDDEEEYDSSYDPDEEEYNQWVREHEKRYGSNYYSDYQDEGFEESFY